MWYGRVVCVIGLAYGLTQIPASPQPARASSAKVETLVVAPFDRALDLYISPHGGHVAAVTQKGSRWAINYDGVAGPALDEIVGAPKQRVSFSPDSQRYAYIGRSGQEYIVFVDGKESNRFPMSSTAWEPGMTALPGVVTSVPQFSPNSKHVFFFVTVDPTGKGLHQLFFDGQLVPAPFKQVRHLALSADGEHYAYVAATNPVETIGGIEDKEFALIVDGKPAGYQGLEPQFTADGKHLFTRIHTANTASLIGHDTVVLLDGKPYIRAQDAHPYVPPAGYGVVTVVVSQKLNAPMTQFLVMDGKRLPGTDAEQITRVTFSPDGRHWAAECRLPNSKGEFMIIDGKKGSEYLSFSSLLGTLPVAPPIGSGEMPPAVVFSPDSTRSAYIGISGSKLFAVIDGVEYETGFVSIGGLTYGAGGKRVAFIGAANGLERTIVVDGKATQNNLARLDDFAFSPDGSHYAYTADGAGTDQRPTTRRLVVDGVHDTGIVIGGLLGNGRGLPFLFSPDGKHVAVHGYTNTAVRKAGLFIDGKHIPDAPNTPIWNPTFTPDGRHFLGFAQVNDPSGRQPSVVIYVDGRAAAKVDGNVSNDRFMSQTRGAWDMGADGVLTAIGVIGPNFVRLRITPPADTSIDTLVATGAK